MIFHEYLPVVYKKRKQGMITVKHITEMTE